MLDVLVTPQESPAVLPLSIQEGGCDEYLCREFDGALSHVRGAFALVCFMRDCGVRCVLGWSGIRAG